MEHDTVRNIMPTLVLPPRLSDDCLRLRNTAIAAGWGVYAATGWRLPEGLNLPDPKLYADPLFADVAAARLGVALLEPPLDLLPRLPESSRRRNVMLTTLGEARTLDGPVFVKPGDDKCFPARVYASGRDLPGDDLLPADNPALVSEPVEWEVEYRCFIREGRVAAISAYLRAGELVETDGKWPAPPEEQAEALACAAAVLASPQSASLFPGAFVLDVGRMARRGWGVVEANPAWGSGMYGCDPVAVLAVLARATFARFAVTQADQPFVRSETVIEG